MREYNKEPLPHPKSSNFISHLKQPTCPIPEEFSFENRGKEQPETSGLAGPVTGYAAQRKMILDFTAQGKIAPARKFTKEGFRTAFVKGVVEDGLPFTFGEGRGMKKLFEYSLPEVSLPKRMSVRRDLDVLYTALQSELWARLKVCPTACRVVFYHKLSTLDIQSLKSCPSIAFDIWSSRNSASHSLVSKPSGSRLTGFLKATSSTLSIWMGTMGEQHQESLSLILSRKPGLPKR